MISTQRKLLREIAIPINHIDVLVGSDVLLLLASSMYNDPLIVYRELVQNSLDSLDASSENVGETGRVKVFLDRKNRIISVRDNGFGISASKFAERMCSLGGSVKRSGAKQRGFRGVGRLASLAYCRTLRFSSRPPGSKVIFQAAWDCVRLKDFLSGNPGASIIDAIKAALTLSKRVAEDNDDAHFFEASLEGVVRLENDCLLDPDAVHLYLADSLPAKLSESFPFAEEVSDFLSSFSPMTKHAIVCDVDGKKTQVYKRLGRNITFRNGRKSDFTNLQTFTINGLDGDVAALGWIAHHEYPGSISSSNSAFGLRIRIGGIQIGDESLASSLFPEHRFNAWCIGEINIVDSNIIPNGRRDGLEPNLHWQNVANHISVISKTIITRCRKQSSLRNSVKRFESLEEKLQNFVDCLVAFPQLWAISDVWLSSVESVFKSTTRHECQKTSEARERFQQLRPYRKKPRERDYGTLDVIAAVLRDESEAVKVLEIISFIIQKTKAVKMKQTCVKEVRPCFNAIANHFISSDQPQASTELS